MLPWNAPERPGCEHLLLEVLERRCPELGTHRANEVAAAWAFLSVCVPGTEAITLGNPQLKMLFHSVQFTAHLPCRSQHGQVLG